MYYKYKNSYKTTQKFYAVRFDMASLWPVNFWPHHLLATREGVASRFPDMLIMLWSCNALGKRGDVSDGCVWRCPQCKTTKTVREYSFFTKSRMPLKKWLCCCTAGCASTLPRMQVRRQWWITALSAMYTGKLGECSSSILLMPV